VRRHFFARDPVSASSTWSRHCPIEGAGANRRPVFPSVLYCNGQVGQEHSALPRQIESSLEDSPFPHEASAQEEPFSIPLVVRNWIPSDSTPMNGR
jgi:hypothetical protein